MSAIAIAAVRVPAALGVNVTLIVQLLVGARLVPHVLLCAKSVLLAPVTLMLPRVSSAVPVFVTVTFCAGLVVPVAWLAKVSVAGFRLTRGAVPPVAGVVTVATFEYGPRFPAASLARTM